MSIELNTSEAQFLHKLIIDGSIQKYFDAQTRGISSDSFTETVQKQVWEFIISYTDRYHSLPTLSAIQEQVPDFTPGSVNDRFEFYRDKVVNAHQRNVIAAFTQELATKLGRRDEDIVNFIGTKYQELIKGARLSDFGSFREMLDRITQYRQAVASGESPMGITTGIPQLDEHFMGYRPGDYGIISGRPGEGKTTVALFQAFSAFMSGKKVSYITLEMPREQLFEKLDALATGITINKIKRMNLTDQELELYERRAVEIGRYEQDFRIHDRIGECTPTTIEAVLTQDEPDILFLDPIYLMKTQTKGWEGIKENSNKIKSLAMQYRKPIIALSQIGRSAEDLMRQGQEITVANLSFSDALGQDADHVFILTGNTKTNYHQAKRFTSVKLRGAGVKDIAVKWDPSTNHIEYMCEYSQLPIPTIEQQQIITLQNINGVANA